VISAVAVLPRSLVLYGDEALRRRGCTVGGIGMGNADVISLDSKLLGQVTSAGISPAFDVVVPGVSGIAHDLRLLGMSSDIRDISGREQRRDLRR
jgi:hypothetical protein